jgi:hypothetical protein
MLKNKHSGLIGCMDAPEIDEQQEDGTRTYKQDKGF